ncbi:MAG TPA: tagatose-bisphosphate aldolase [Caldithrix abyssi]|uniref:Tagatose-bisphosphate aldolase n=1 Tax=Caldithrix abyssi TaxID=187145 RepID=A0A7V4TZE2_CALAY|nr:tagatose-bisphosphate aldolase [Caldithrix abyssi]
MTAYIKTVIERNKKNGNVGISSICSANYYVLSAAMKRSKKDGQPLLIEATSNQVDQYGGYTGMKPDDFKKYIYSIANELQLPADRLILGGDHLGPNRWQEEPAIDAMSKAKVQIMSYVQAGFRKIHLDASMPLQGDTKKDNMPLEIELVADRTAELCAAAEEAAKDAETKPFYVIGTDVPIPGGALTSHEDIRITPVHEVEETIKATRSAFEERGLTDAWQRVIALVAQPGVEFSDTAVFEYRKDKAQPLKEKIKEYPAIAYEAHSTDYQKKEDLRHMVNDHFAILKVGPWLTYAFREAVFALAFIEKEMLTGYASVQLSQLEETIENVMLWKPDYWKKHYHGNEVEQRLARRYSLSDRIRYYWPQKEIQEALNQLFENLTTYKPSLSLLSQYLPLQYEAIRAGEIGNNPLDIVLHKIDLVLQKYIYACGLS